MHDAEVRGVKLNGASKERKRHEMRLIFKLGTSQPRGLKTYFRFILRCARALFQMAYDSEAFELHTHRTTPVIFHGHG